ncbi:MAG: HAMP domain-containing protein [Spirulina sp. SIO3F2]|nr:HAMP domain-containing protein [Spirulina sp. SIO3F2]
MSQTNTKTSLRSLLIVPFVVQLGLVVGVVGWLSFRNGQRAINDLANQLETEIAIRIEQEVENFLTQPHAVHEVILAGHRSGLLDLNDWPTVEPYFWRQAQTMLVPDLLWATPDGKILGVQGKDDGSFAVRFKDESTNGNRQKYLLDTQGQRTELIQDKPYDTTARPWYQAALAAQQPSWTELYPSSNVLFPEVSAVHPVYDATGELLGVLGSELTLKHLGSFMHDLEVSPSGQAFIVEQDGDLVVSSTEEAPFATVDAVDVRQRVLESQNPVTQATAQYIVDELGGFEAIQTAQSFAFQRAGERQLVRIQPIQRIHGIDWLVVIVVPERDFMAQIHANTRTTIGLSVGALVVATVLGLYTSRWLVQPLARLNSASEAIASGDLEQTVPDSNIQEVSHLAQTFNRMGAQLQAAFASLRQLNQELEERVGARTVDLQAKNQELEVALERIQTTQTQMVAQEKLASLGSLTAGIAHEIKNPLNFINNFADLSVELGDELQEALETHQAKLDPEWFEEVTEILDTLKANVGRIESHSQRADKIVANMLLHARNGRDEWGAVHLNTLLGDVINLAYHGMRASYQSFKLAIDEQYDQSINTITACAQDLNRALLNMVSNACYATYQRQIAESEESAAFQPQLTVTTVNQPDTVEIRLRDNGMGMTPEVKAKIFEQFFTTKPAGEGTGLGLSLAYNIIVEQHQGAIAVVSEPNAYTEFTITLPKESRPSPVPTPSGLGSA